MLILSFNVNKIGLIDILNWVFDFACAFSAFLAWHTVNKALKKESEPILSFKLFTKNNLLYLKIKNTGKSPASNIKIKLIEFKNNADENISLEGIFKNEIF